ncbi:hypothetical protein [Pandoraea norimbergensis]|uniref:Uncharacterized protein n=1 Tax=Pandoraea norimbergensis TaxID=93219 RepID=A0ABM5WIW1_9BURK|nr:hypothetical protein [Pandoraea norimbergensis]ALS60364.1 hypothetical protein AT302_11860 [Pandoraea norimbergensis]
MTCLNETIVGAMLFSLGGFAFAGGPGTDSSEGMMVANIAPIASMPPETAALAPEPRHFLHRFETTPQPPAPTASNEGPALFPFTPSVARIDDTVDSAYIVPPSYDVRHLTGSAAASPGQPPGQATGSTGTSALRGLPSSVAQVSIVQWNNEDSKLGSQPQRGLQVRTDDWVVSASARVALFRSHETGATVYVRRRF